MSNPQNQNNLSQNRFLQQRSQGMNELNRKRTDFHKEIRRKHIEEIIKAKRKILYQNFAKTNLNETQSEKKTLIGCLKAISSNEKVSQNICSLVNLLALQKPFQHYALTDSNPSKQQVYKFCTDLIDLLFKKVIPDFSHQPKCRIYCLNALANLFADPYCENVRYIKIIVQTLDKLYGDIETWGCDDEMIEIYYMIANLQRKTIIHTELMSVEKILGWGETGISKLPSDCLKSLTEGFIKLFSDVDQMFNSSHKRSFYTDHFRASREIIIQNMIKRLIATGQGNKLNVKGELSLDSESLLVIFKFLNKNRVYVLKILMQWQEDMQDKKRIRLFCDRLLGLINQPTLKTTTLRQIGSFLINILRYYHLQEQSQQLTNHTNYQLSQQIDCLNDAISVVNKQFLTSQPLTQMVISICHQSFQCKIIYLKIIYELIYNMQRSLQLTSRKQLQQGLLFILVDKKLQDILSDFLAQMHGKLKNVDLLRIILDIYHVVINMSQGKLSLKLKQHVHSLLQSPPQFIPQDIFSIMEDLFKLHEEKMQETII